MRVSAWSNGENTYGISVGNKNRAQFFKRNWDEIEVEIEGEMHRIPITSGFWRDCPEVRAPVIRDWLYAHGHAPWPKGRPPRMELIPLGENRFGLVP